jgi:hypothetical protein
MGKMMNKIILQLKDSSLRAWYIYPAKHPQEHASQSYGRNDEQDYPSAEE